MLLQSMPGVSQVYDLGTLLFVWLKLDSFEMIVVLCMSSGDAA